MIEDCSLKEFLMILGSATGDEVIDLISRFQTGGLKVAGFSIDDLPDLED